MPGAAMPADDPPRHLHHSSLDDVTGEDHGIDRRMFLAGPIGTAAAFLAISSAPALLVAAGDAEAAGLPDQPPLDQQRRTTMPQAIPTDDPARRLTVRNSDGGDAVHVSVAGGTYTLLVRGAETAGRYCLIDMHVPPTGGPPPHRHDFEEMFTVLEGQVEFTFRGAKRTAVAGETVNIPANAPHAFKNVATEPARLLCMCTPAGQDDFFLEVGDRVATRTAPPPPLSEAETAERMKKAQELAPRYRTELLPPPA